ncbi:MAG: D-alanine--D-alanine ligase [Rickettsiaceae bacterium]|nr:D-alanine--D-alanine ligase [Rickettsiaceae bacterium]
MSNFQQIENIKSRVKIISNNGVKHVALVIGGMSCEREVSISSGRGVCEALVALGYKVTEVDMGRDFAKVIDEINPDIVFNCLHGTYGEDGCVPGILNILKIPYTHSGLMASSIAFNKIISKDIMRANNINYIPDVVISKGDELKVDPFPRPYVIKPVSEGSSIGVEIIFPEDDFNFANYEFKFGDQIIVEKYIKGRELQVPVLDGKALEILELKFINKRFYDYEAKYTEGFTEHILPSSLPSHIRRQTLDISEKLYKAFRCRGIVRCEMIYSEDEDTLYVLEINTHPGMTPLSICPEIALYCGIGFNDLVKILVESAKYDE